MKGKISNKINFNNIFDKIIFFIEFLLSFLLGLNIYKILYKYQDYKYISKFNLIISILILFAIISIIILNLKKYKEIIQKLFLTFIIPIGMLFVILLLPMWTPDEEGHMFKAYDLSQGNIITKLGENNEGDIYVPKHMLDIVQKENKLNYSEIHKELGKKTDYNDLVPVQTIFKTYFSINYLTGGIVFSLARVFNINILLACYLVKLLNFIVYLIARIFNNKNYTFWKISFFNIYVFTNDYSTSDFFIR